MSTGASETLALIGKDLDIAKTGAVLDALSAASLVMSALHGIFVGGGLELKSGPPLRDGTHYGPAGHDVDAGKQIIFKATLTMHNPLSPSANTCLSDIGMDIPKDGPIPGVEIDWQNIDLLAQDIDAYGTVTYQPSDQKTDANGVSEAIFTPKNEVIAGPGTRITATGPDVTP